MLPSFRHLAVSWLPVSVVAALRKRRRKRLSARRKRAREAAIARFGLVDTADLQAAMRTLGVEPGGVLLVQSSLNDMPTYSGRPIELLGALRELVGPQGTLLMPAYIVEPSMPDGTPLDVMNLPTYTGVLNELFRRMPSVLRSPHPRHSLCGEGPLAAALLAGHEALLYADGPDSPFDRLRQRDDALILTIGLPPAFTSFLHWIEDFEPARLPLEVHEPTPKEYVVRRADGTMKAVRDMQVKADVAARIDLTRVASRLGPDVLQFVHHRGIDLGLYRAKPLAQKLLWLRDQGIFHYH